MTLKRIHGRLRMAILNADYGNAYGSQVFLLRLVSLTDKDGYVVDMSIDDIAVALNLSAPTATQQISRAVRNGWLERIGHRQVQLTLAHVPPPSGPRDP